MTPSKDTAGERLARIEEKVDGLIREMRDFIADSRRHRDQCNQQFGDHEQRLRAIELSFSGIKGGWTFGQKALALVATICGIAGFVMSLLK